jgi:ubiquinone/menaquinone biosynthesis C-methylase UbiE
MWAKARASGLEMMSVGRCNQYNRERWLERVLKEVPPGSRILDAGAGEQQYKRFCTHLRYVAQDFGQYNGKGDGKGLQTGRWNQEGLDIVADIASIPEPDGSFQAVMCVEVFEHIPEPIKALREFRRLLVTGGYLIITAPFCSLTHFAPYHFYTGFNRYFYEKHLPELGFEILELVPNGNYFEYLAQELRRVPEMAWTYSRQQTRLRHRAILRMLLAFLQKCSSADRGSSEVLSFGLHVLAAKR